MGKDAETVRASLLQDVQEKTRQLRDSAKPACSRIQLSGAFRKAKPDLILQSMLVYSRVGHGDIQTEMRRLPGSSLVLGFHRTAFPAFYNGEMGAILSHWTRSRHGRGKEGEVPSLSFLLMRRLRGAASLPSFPQDQAAGALQL